ncbi:hypothetical protein MTsPCn9_35180 [Croceitalea sp. MTPC9]|jgi:hypothetical protein|uniref:hypothetical protein n=2 Tax=Bacteroidota TaxID=976 RepID=UPI000C578A60|nr:hypothetical protein [Rickettsiales bacterium]GMN12165.1 hypothetical protein MTsPCn6_34970 [Croceitalea sp. MTPC6]GMN18578.1 hypothetical protein MTsPCn9_35180 [Croceitalea sp. MTPC9]
MKLAEIHQLMGKTNFSKDEKKTIFALIDYKVENDMDKVINRMERVEERMENTLKTFIWVIGIATTVISVLLGIIALKG